MSPLAKAFIYLIVAILMSVPSIASSNKIICYVASWAHYRNGNGKFAAEDVDPTSCTHVIYAFAKLVDNRITVGDPYLELVVEGNGLGHYQRLKSLKKKNPKLLTMIAIGGWNEGSKRFSEMSGSAHSRKTFIESCLQFLSDHGFDGVDMDWEYPANQDGSPSDRENFSLLLKEMKEAFEPDRYLLSAAIPANNNALETAYNIEEINRHLDFINLMSYDFHHGSGETNHNSPLYSKRDCSSQECAKSINLSVNYLLEKGASAHKIMLGMAFYGRTYELENPQQSGLCATVVRGADAGQYTNEKGVLSYYEICEKLHSEEDWKVVYDDHQMAPYAFKGTLWLSFDNSKSITAKINYIKKKQLGGVMIWTIDMDDFRGLWHDVPFHLLTTIKRELNTHEEERSSCPTKRTEAKNIQDVCEMKPFFERFRTMYH